tara:strand:- start:2201 stop:2746 length:546 start_codon:yes stop_codon:yes gene_type:complete
LYNRNWLFYTIVFSVFSVLTLSSCDKRSAEPLQQSTQFLENKESSLEEEISSIYVLELAYNEDKTIELSTKEARQGYPDQNEDGTYSYKIISSNNQILHSANFINPSLIETSLSGEEISITPPKSFVEDGTSIPETESITQYPITFELLIPYFNNAERVDIYDDLSSLVTSIPVSDIQIES